MSVSPQELFKVFLEEAGRHIASCEKLLLTDRPAWNERRQHVLRLMHSVKGMAQTLGLSDISAQAHRIEDAAEKVEEPKSLLEDVRELRRRHEALRPNRLHITEVSSRRLDRLLDIVLTADAAHQRLEHLLGPIEADVGRYETREALKSALDDLRQEVLELRLLPVRDVVPLLENGMRHWARARGVRVAFAVRGDTIRIDRAILERLLDPMNQLLRNAIAHGVEGEDERAESGKSPRARIELAIKREGERLVFTIRDDGRGLNPNDVVKRALERGVLRAYPEPPLTDDAALMLLTRDGMSREDKADALGGRGVGLATVRQQIERLGGQLRLESSPKLGFAAHIDIPPRVAVLKAFVVQASGKPYAIPMDAVAEVVEAQRLPIDMPKHTVEGWLVGGAHRRDSSASDAMALLVDLDGTRAGVVVDRVVGVRELIVRPLGPPLDTIPPWSGATVLPDGGVAMVLDPAKLRLDEHDRP